MKYPLRKLVHYYRSAGLWGVCCKMSALVRHRCWSETQWLVYERRLTGAPARDPGRLLRREICLRDLVESHHAKARAFPEATNRRLELGEICHGFFLSERLATVGWSSAGYLELDEDVTLPCPDGVGLFDFITFEEFRSHGYYTDALVQLISEMQLRGFARALIAVDPSNVVSIRGIERAGFRPLARVTRRWRCAVRLVGQWKPDWKCGAKAEIR